MSASRPPASVPFGAPPEVHSVNMVFFDDHWREQEHASDFCEFQWLRGGRSVLEIGGRREAVIPDDFVLIPRDTPHRDIFAPDTPYEVLMIHFVWPPWEEALTARLSAAALRAVGPEVRREAAYLLDRLFAAAARRRPHGRALANALFHAALLLLLSAADAVDSAHAGDADSSAGSREASAGAIEEDDGSGDYAQRRGRWLVEEAKAIVARNFHRHLTAADVAAELGVSEHHLARRFAAGAGESLHDYLLSRRFARAEALLLEGRLTVAQVARATGFANGGYFAKAFKKRYGQTPKTFLATRPAKKW